jgi:hypothetical protein
VGTARDRDNAFSRFEGVVATLGGAIRPEAVRFGLRHTDLYGLVHSGQRPDRGVLPEPAASSVPASVRSRNRPFIPSPSTR